MSQPDRIEFITELVTPLAASLGLAVWGVELGGAARPIARIYVDVLPGAEPAPSEKASDDDLLPQGVTIDQCAELSRLAGLALDVEDPFATNWTLEISSPGLQRPFFKIDQLRNYVGRELEVDAWHRLIPGRGARNFPESSLPSPTRYSRSACPTPAGRPKSLKKSPSPGPLCARRPSSTISPNRARSSAARKTPKIPRVHAEALHEFGTEKGHRPDQQRQRARSRHARGYA
ncbi:MAG: ribosome maturation factor RimP [Bilophila wadsworthia]